MPGLEQKRVFAPPTGAQLCWTLGPPRIVLWVATLPLFIICS
jgi:hypothetical protein